MRADSTERKFKARAAVSLRLVMFTHPIQSDLSGSPAGQEGEGRRKLDESFVKFFDELRLPVYRYLFRVGLCPEEAEDITQEVFLRLFKHLLEQGREENLRGWVFRVAQNLALNLALHQRGNRNRLRTKSLEDWAGLNDLVIDLAPNPEQFLLGKERIARFERCSLSHRQRQCISLRIEGYRYSEIAEILGVTEASVAESLRRAIKKLRGDEKKKLPEGRI